MLNNKPEDKPLTTAITKINDNIVEFINEFDVNHIDYNKFINKLKNENIISIQDPTNDTNVINLYKYVNIKNFIGKIVWYILAGTVIASISYNNIVNQQCQKSLKEIQRDIDIIKNDDDDEEDEDEDEDDNLKLF